METTSTRAPVTQPAPAHSNRRDRKQIARWVILALAAAWLIAFVISNSEQVKVSFVFGDVTLSLIWVMIICAVTGTVLAVLIPLRSRRR